MTDCLRCNASYDGARRYFCGDCYRDMRTEADGSAKRDQRARAREAAEKAYRERAFGPDSDKLNDLFDLLMNIPKPAPVARQSTSLVQVNGSFTDAGADEGNTYPNVVPVWSGVDVAENEAREWFAANPHWTFGLDSILPEHHYIVDKVYTWSERDAA